MSHSLMKSLLLIILVAYPFTGYPCSGCRISINEATKEAKTILFGKVIERKIVKRFNEVDIKKESPWKVYRYKIKVQSVYKGEFNKIVIIESVKDGAACGVKLKMFRKYLLFSEEFEDTLITSRCHPNRIKNRRNKALISRDIDMVEELLNKNET